MAAWPDFIAFLWVCVAISLACGLIVELRVSRSPKRWLDDPRFAIRWGYRAALMLAWYLPCVGLTWTVATVLVNCGTRFVDTLGLRAMQIAVAGLPALMMIGAATLHGRHIRARSSDARLNPPSPSRP